VVGTKVTAFAGGCDGNDVSNGVGPADRDGVSGTEGLAGTGVPVTGVPVDAGPVQPAARIIPANKKIRRRVLFFIITGSLQEPINSLVMRELICLGSSEVLIIHLAFLPFRTGSASQELRVRAGACPVSLPRT